METTVRPSAEADIDLGTVLGVWAHPDDEAYCSAGLMAKATAEGSRVVVATATRGERGTPDPLTWPPERLSSLREQELASSLAAVGVREHHWLGHRDGELRDIKPAVGIGQVAELLRLVRPDTVVTFGPDGMTGHPDHRAISAWVTAACRAAPRPPRLWYATVTPEFHAEWGSVNDSIGLWFDPANAPCTDAAELAHVVRCTGDLLARKSAALRAHDSQTLPLIALLGQHTFRDWWAVEYFRAAEVGASSRATTRR